jgi:hypothetical protein
MIIPKKYTYSFLITTTFCIFGMDKKQDNKDKKIPEEVLGSKLFAMATRGEIDPMLLSALHMCKHIKGCPQTIPDTTEELSDGHYKKVNKLGCVTVVVPVPKL